MPFEPFHWPKATFSKNILHPSWGSDADDKLPRPIVCLKDSVFFRRANHPTGEFNPWPRRVLPPLLLKVGTSVTTHATFEFWTGFGSRMPPKKENVGCAQKMRYRRRLSASALAARRALSTSCASNHQIRGESTPLSLYPEQISVLCEHTFAVGRGVGCRLSEVWAWRGLGFGEEK